MISQKDAVYNAVMSALNEQNIAIPESGVKSILTKEVKELVYEVIKDGIEYGDIPYDGPKDKINKYVIGLLANWVNKDPRLNGGSCNQTARSFGDPAIDETYKLYKVVRGTCLEMKVKSKLDTLRARQKINIEHLPPHLRSVFK